MSFHCLFPHRKLSFVLSEFTLDLCEAAIPFRILLFCPVLSILSLKRDQCCILALASLQCWSSVIPILLTVGLVLSTHIILITLEACLRLKTNETRNNDDNRNRLKRREAPMLIRLIKERSNRTPPE